VSDRIFISRLIGTNVFDSQADQDVVTRDFIKSELRAS
jgi:hypothetical protein